MTTPTPKQRLIQKVETKKAIIQERYDRSRIASRNEECLKERYKDHDEFLKLIEEILPNE